MMMMMVKKKIVMVILLIKTNIYGTPTRQWDIDMRNICNIWSRDNHYSHFTHRKLRLRDVQTCPKLVDGLGFNSSNLIQETSLFSHSRVKMLSHPWLNLNFLATDSFCWAAWSFCLFVFFYFLLFCFVLCFVLKLWAFKFIRIWHCVQ